MPFLSMAIFCKCNSFYWGRKQGKFVSICGLFPAPTLRWVGATGPVPFLKTNSPLLSYSAGSSGNFPTRLNSHSGEGESVMGEFAHRDFCFAQQAVSGTETGSRCSLFTTKQALPLPAPFTNGFLTGSFRQQPMQKRNKSHCFHCSAEEQKERKFLCLGLLINTDFQGCRNAH